MATKSRKKVTIPSVVTAAVAAPQPSHFIVRARAGTGKTTTLVEGMAVMRGGKSTIEPSPQQFAVWDMMRQSANVPSIRFTCFNKAIATTLQERLVARGLDKAGCEAGTMHSFGFKAILSALGRQQPNQYVVTDYLAESLRTDPREMMRKNVVLVRAVTDLVSLCKMTLMDPSEENLKHLVDYYDIDFGNDFRQIADLVPSILERCKNPKGKITFDDMIWLPVVLNLPVTRFDLLLVDECQDLNRCQQQLAIRTGERLGLVGDDRQAIYGFSGADVASMNWLQSELESHTRGCQVLPLTVTRRCPKSVVREAAKYVPDFEAYPTNPEGTVRDVKYVTDSGSFMDEVQYGDMVLSRTNAPLVSLCFRALRNNRKATIQGRDIGGGLVRLVNRLKAENVADLAGKLSDWYAVECQKEQAKRFPNDQRLINLQDKYDCLQMFLTDQPTVESVVQRIESIFTDADGTDGIRLSSIHKSKGLEAQNVYLLQIKGAECPHPMAKTSWEKQQEENLLYVGITRAMSNLAFVKN